MSVYSGFATRQQQKRYNQYVQCVLAMLTKRLHRFYMGESCNEAKFHHLLISIHDKMQQMEQSKYHQPHYSHLIADFLKNTAEVFDQVGHISRMKEEDPFNQTFSKMHQSNVKIKFNTINMHTQNIQEDFKMQPQQPHRNSRKTLNQRKINFKTRVKTVTPEYQSKPVFFTPQKKSSLQQPKIEKKQKQDLLEMAERSRQNNPSQIQKIQHLSKNRPLSPREFLRQTVKGKESFSHMALRTKQKHQKLVKL